MSLTSAGIIVVIGACAMSEMAGLAFFLLCLHERRQLLSERAPAGRGSLVT